MSIENISFLQPTINSIRKSIKDIEDSYNNFWDVLAELLQNSVDAINKKESKKGNINISINSVEKKIYVKDDGIGIQYEKIPVLLNLFESDKDSDPSTIGEKGVGLKFVIFQSGKFVLKTKNKSEDFISEITIDDAKTLKKKKDESQLFMQSTKINHIDNFEGTEITISDVENCDKIFSMNFKTLEFILRTKTAVGNVNNVFENAPNIKVTLEVIDANGIIINKEIEYRYWLPTDSVASNEKIDIETYRTWLCERDRSDTDKRKKLKDKVMIIKEIHSYNDIRDIKFWACFVPQRNIFNLISIKDGLLKSTDLDQQDIMDEKSQCIHECGIYTSVKGMPTGITIANPSTGYAGYWSNLFIMIEDRCLNFDIGRKNIPGQTKKMYERYLRDIFNTIIGLVSKYIGGEPTVTTNAVWERDDIINEINSLVPLNNNNVIFEKLPSEQEASVAAIFYELIGSQKIKDVTPIISGYKNKYDLYARYKKHFVIIEFKSHLRNVIKDFNDATKLFNEIDYLICWDVNDSDISELYNVGIDVSIIEDSELFLDKNDYISVSTHRMVLNSISKPIYVIDLKRVLNFN